jgi:hypothetical protein
LADDTTSDEVDNGRERDEDRVAGVPAHVEEVASDQEQQSAPAFGDQKKQANDGHEKDRKLDGIEDQV